MSAVDAPPGVAVSDLPAGEFAATPRSRRLARRVFVYVCGAGGVTLAVAARRLYIPMVELLFMAPMVCMAVAAVGYAVRRARVRIDADGVRWGWTSAGFRMRRDRIRRVRAYRDAVAFTPARGSTWYLSRRDWAGFDGFVPALDAAGIPLSRAPGAAPLSARLQSYGAVLDALLVADAVVATGTLAAVLWL